MTLDKTTGLVFSLTDLLLLASEVSKNPTPVPNLFQVKIELCHR